MSPWSLTASSLATVRLNSRSSKKPFTFWRLFRRRRPALRVDWSLHQNRVMFCVMDGGNRWIREKAAASLNPSQVETTLIQLSERWPANALPLDSIIEQFPLGELAMLHLLAVSSICATRLTQNPETLLWLSQPEVCMTSRGYPEMLSELHALAGDSVATQDFAALRFWKGREMTRVALRELANVAPLEETTGELSQVAEICIRRVFDHWNTELRKRHGSPSADFVILGLGKLGGGELNHSSDVDLLFLYGEEGQLTPHISYHEFFNRLGKKILETFSTPHPAGSLFRIDLRLRPVGSAGPLARSLESMENYYAGFGETWERLALIKARGIAGSRELAYEFLRQHQPFIYPKSTNPDLLDEIASIKPTLCRWTRKLCDASHLASVFRPAKISPRLCMKGCALFDRFFNESSPKRPRREPRHLMRLIWKFSTTKDAQPRHSPISLKALQVSTSRHGHDRYLASCVRS